MIIDTFGYGYNDFIKAKDIVDLNNKIIATFKLFTNKLKTYNFYKLLDNKTAILTYKETK